MWQTRIDPELLISLIENRPLIWDKTLESYKDKNQRAAAWREVCITLKDDFEGMDEEERQNYAKNVVKKWNHIRDSWLRSLKSESASSVFVKKYRYHKQLSFLRNILEPAETSDSVNNAGINQDNTDIENAEMENLTTNHNEEIERDPSDVNESPRQENPTSGARRRRENTTSGAKRFKKSNVPRKKLNVMNQKNMSCLDCQLKTQKDSQNEERNLSFFKSLLPTVALLNDDQILQFYGGVISLLQNIKSDNRDEWTNETQTAFNYTYQSPQRYFTPQNVQSTPSATSIQSSLQIDDLQPSPTIEVVMKSEIVDCDSL